MSVYDKIYVKSLIQGSTINAKQLTFTGATTDNVITVPDNLNDGLRIDDVSGTNYIKLVTVNNSEKIRLLQDVKFKQGILITDTSEPANPSNGEGRLYKKTGNDGIFWKPDSAGAEVDLTTSVSLQYIRSAITNTESPYTILTADEIVGIDTTAGVVIVTLPQISTIGGSNYKKYNIIDEAGNASVNNITVNTTGGDTINKNASPTIIAVDHTSLTVYNDGVSNWIIL